MSGICQYDLPTFKNNKNIVEIYKEIYLYKNFLPYNENQKYSSKLNFFSNWNSHGNYEIGDHDKYNNLYSWENKLSIDFNTDFLTISIINLIAPVHWIFRHTNFIRLSTGESAPLSRSHEETSALRTKPAYKLSYYAGEWTGGKLVFPEIKFEYTPESNDLLIFSPDKEYVHFTEEITSGTRYCYVDMLNYHPGYFMG